ncbi:MAG: hypothetical protein U0835_22475 [Isosphaeraceae bacterium]
MLMVGVPLASRPRSGCCAQPAVYEAEAMIFIEPPQYDPVLGTLLSRDVSRPRRDGRSISQQGRQAQGKVLAERKS